MLPDGTDWQMVLDGGSWPSWSPEAARIAFAGAGERSADIFTVNPDGTKMVNITNTGGGGRKNRLNEGRPAWRP